MVNMGIPMEDIIQTDCTDAQKPCNHNRCKQESYSVGPVVLKGEQEYEYDTSNRHLNICKVYKSSLRNCKKSSSSFLTYKPEKATAL